MRTRRFEPLAVVDKLTEVGSKLFRIDDKIFKMFVGLELEQQNSNLTTGPRNIPTTRRRNSRHTKRFGVAVERGRKGTQNRIPFQLFNTVRLSLLFTHSLTHLLVHILPVVVLVAKRSLWDAGMTEYDDVPWRAERGNSKAIMMWATKAHLWPLNCRDRTTTEGPLLCRTIGNYSLILGQ